MKQILELEAAKKYDILIDVVRVLVADDRRILTDPTVKAWCGRRWRNLFISEAVKDEAALQVATKDSLLRKDNRPNRQRIAERFLRGDNLRDWQLEMPEAQFDALDNCALVFVPGLLNGLLPKRAFETALPQIAAELGIPIVRADCHPIRGCEANVADIEKAIELGLGLADDATELLEGIEEKPQLVLVGYSKGVPDILTTLVKRPDLRDRISAIFSWAGAAGGSFLADSAYATIQNFPLDGIEDALLAIVKALNPLIDIPTPFSRANELDVSGAIRDLTTKQREAFYEQHQAMIDALDIPFFNITGSATMKEVPYFQLQGLLQINRYDANNDMQVTQSQASVNVPMGTHLAMLKAHHWDASYDPFPKNLRLGSPNLDHPFPKKAAMMAMLKFTAELGLID